MPNMRCTKGATPARVRLSATVLRSITKESCPTRVLIRYYGKRWGIEAGFRDIKRDDGSQQSMWVATADQPQGGGHPFYERLNQILSTSGFDAFVENLCAGFYARMGRPSLAPGRYFRLLLVGYFEGLDSERAIAWRTADSLSLRSFLRLAPPASPPDHSTISRTRRLLSLETHEAVFTWVLQQLADAGLVRGKTVGVDATTLEANAALRSIVRRDTGEDYTAFLTRLAEASGIATPTRAELARFDKSRKKRKKTSNADWTHPHDPDARVTKMKAPRRAHAGIRTKLEHRRAPTLRAVPRSGACRRRNTYRLTSSPWSSQRSTNCLSRRSTSASELTKKNVRLLHRRQ